MQFAPHYLRKRNKSDPLECGIKKFKTKTKAFWEEINATEKNVWHSFKLSVDYYTNLHEYLLHFSSQKHKFSTKSTSRIGSNPNMYLSV